MFYNAPAAGPPGLPADSRRRGPARTGLVARGVALARYRGELRRRCRGVRSARSPRPGHRLRPGARRRLPRAPWQLRPGIPAGAVGPGGSPARALGGSQRAAAVTLSEGWWRMRGGPQLAGFMYHEVTDRPLESGFLRPGAVPYTLSRAAFDRHLERFRAGSLAPELVTAIDFTRPTRHLLLTFDDGGRSAVYVGDRPGPVGGGGGSFFVSGGGRAERRLRRRPAGPVGLEGSLLRGHGADRRAHLSGSGRDPPRPELRPPHRQSSPSPPRHLPGPAPRRHGRGVAG